MPKLGGGTCKKKFSALRADFVPPKPDLMATPLVPSADTVGYCGNDGNQWYVRYKQVTDGNVPRYAMFTIWWRSDAWWWQLHYIDRSVVMNALPWYRVRGSSIGLFEWNDNGRISPATKIEKARIHRPNTRPRHVRLSWQSGKRGRSRWKILVDGVIHDGDSGPGSKTDWSITFHSFL